MSRLRRVFASPFARYLLAWAGVLIVLSGLFVTLTYRETRGVLLSEFRTALRDDIALLQAITRDDGITALERAIARRVGAGDGRGVYLLLAPDGSRRAGNLLPWSGALDVPAQASLTLLLSGSGERAVAELLVLPGGYRLLVGRRAVYDEVGHHLIRNYLGLSVVMLLVSLGAALALTRHVRHRLQRITETTRAIRTGHLEARVPQDNSGDELASLVGEINSMLDQQHKLLAFTRSSAAAIAHDLRHPMAQLHNRLSELALEQQPVAADEIAPLIDDVDHILQVFGALLRLAKLESGAVVLNRQSLDLGELVHELVSLYRPVLQDAGRTIRIEGRGQMLLADRELMIQALSNLLANALEYGGGDVLVTMTPDGFVVRDHGTGVPERGFERLGEPFYRVDASRGTQGNGLGLVLVKAIASAHGGSVRFANAEPGLRVTVRLSAGGAA
ncbi:ATP-binding protein [Chitinibacteraceae bacterium HSL-7]